MPAEIVTQTCPAPECNLLPGDVEQFVEELAAYYALFAPAFRRPEQTQWGQVYLNGLLGDLPRKTTERIALNLGHNVRDLQHFIGQSQWPIEPVLAIHQQLIAETLGEEDGVALIDESGVVKQGDHSVGGGPQYCGSVGKGATPQGEVDKDVTRGLGLGTLHEDDRFPFSHPCPVECGNRPTLLSQKAASWLPVEDGVDRAF